MGSSHHPSISLAKPTPTQRRWVGVKWHGCCLKRKGPVEHLPCLGPPPPSCGPVQCVGHLGSLSIRCSFAHIWPCARSLDANCFELYSCISWACVCARVRFHFKNYILMRKKNLGKVPLLLWRKCKTSNFGNCYLLLFPGSYTS